MHQHVSSFTHPHRFLDRGHDHHHGIHRLHHRQHLHHQSVDHLTEHRDNSKGISILYCQARNKGAIERTSVAEAGMFFQRTTCQQRNKETKKQRNKNKTSERKQGGRRTNNKKFPKNKNHIDHGPLNDEQRKRTHHLLRHRRCGGGGATNMHQPAPLVQLDHQMVVQLFVVGGGVVQ